MGSSANGANQQVGRGRLYVDRFDSSGNRTGYRFAGTAEEFKITQSVETVQAKNYAVAGAPIVARATLSNEADISFKLKEFVKENLALHELGTESSYTQAATAVTGETLTSSAVLDRHYKTAKRKIGTVVVKQGATTLVAGTDYDIIDAVAGLIYLRPGSVTITPGSAITVDYIPTAITAPGLDKVIGGTSPAITCGLLFIGDPNTGPSWDFEIWKANITPDGDLALISDQFGEMNFKGVILDDSTNHPTEPLFTAVRKS